ncbi:hypothetical protein D9M68_827710 [compost metagenome]
MISYTEGKEVQHPYTLGDRVEFREKGNSENYVLGGWSSQETDHRWTEGKMAALRFNIENIQPKDLVLTVSACGFLPKRGRAQMVTVKANGVEVATWEVKPKCSEFSSAIPGSILKDSGLKISFVMNEPTRPCEVGDSEDCRRLGMAMRELMISDSGESRFAEK